MSTRSRSLSFDRAADFYDETRLLPRDVADAVRATIFHAMGDPPAPRFLELGIGTGRIALPFLDAGDDYVGVDLSLAMMRRLEAKSAGAPLACADITQLPVPDDTFDAAVAMHVFHLVGAWQRALDEARRVTKPGGWFLWSWHWRNETSVNVRLRRWLAQEAEARGHSTERPGARQEELQDALDRRGAETQEHEVARWRTRSTILAHELDKLAGRTTSDTWMLPDDVFDACLAAVRRRALDEYGSPDYTEPVAERFVLRASRWPGEGA